MRFMFAPLAFLCLFIVQPAYAQGGPDSIYVPGKGYVEKWQLSGVKQARHFGGYKKSAKVSRKTKVAGKTFMPSHSVSWHSSAAPWLSEAKRHVGTNPTGKRSLWCADFVNLALERTGKNGTSSRAAKSFLKYGQRTSARPGAIAVYSRGKRGGHVAIVESVNGNTVTLVSGNCGRKGVCRYTRSVSSALAYVWPS